MNIAEKIKKQTDKILRQQTSGPNAGVVITEDSSGTSTLSNPAADLAAHKISSDHAFIKLSDAPSSYTNQAGKAVIVKETEDGLGFGSASGGRGSFDYGLIMDYTSTSYDWGTLT